MPLAERLAILGSALYFLVGLLAGVWKAVAILRSPAGQAHRYVDVLHRAALMYSFASLLAWKLAELSPLDATAETIAVTALLVFFGLALTSYLVHGALRDTDNQLRAPFALGALALPRWALVAFMVSLVVAELGGFIVLLFGAGRGLRFW